MRYAFNNSKTVVRLSGGRALKTANIFSDNTALMATNREWNITSLNLKRPYGLEPGIGWNYGTNFTQKMILNYKEAYITIDVYRTDFIKQVVIDLDYSTQQVVIYNLKGVSFSSTTQAEFGWEIRKRLMLKMAYISLSLIRPFLMPM